MGQDTQVETQSLESVYNINVWASRTGENTSIRPEVQGQSGASTRWKMETIVPKTQENNWFWSLKKSCACGG